MSRRLRAVAAATAMGALLLLYIVVLGQRAVILLFAESWVAKGMGAALMVLPIVGVWVIVAEFLFGFRASALVDRLAAEEALPTESLATAASGRPDRDAARRAVREPAADAPDSDWRSALRLSLLQDAAGLRSEARASARRAIRLSRKLSH